MSIYEDLLAVGEPLAAGLFEDCTRGLFYRKSLALRRFFESAPLYDYGGGRLYPSGKLYTKTAVSPRYATGFTVNHRRLNALVPGAYEAIRQEFEQFFSSVPKQHTVAGDMYTHSMPHYRRIAAEGLESYIPRIGKIADTDIREGLLHLVEGLRTYMRRIVEYLHTQNADARLIAALEQVPFQPARDIYEALVCHNFVFYLDSCDNVGCLASDLMPYYSGENIVDLLREFYRNVDETDAYSMSLGADYNPLTVQCLEAVKGMRRPMIELFINKNCPDEVWNTALDAVRTSGGQPAFYSYDGMIGGLGRRFPEIRTEDLERFCGGGCTESMLEGICCVGSLDAGVHLLLILREIIINKLPLCRSFEEFYNFYMSAVRDAVDTVTREIAATQERRSRMNPLPMRTLLIDDCIDRGRDFYNDGARYSWSIISFAGMTNVIDSLLVIEDYVFLQKRMSADELIRRLEENDEEFLRTARRHPVRHGIDLPRANALAERLSRDVFGSLDEKKPHYGLGFLSSSIMFRVAARYGKQVGATPDGRPDGAPLAESLGAIYAKDTAGPTAMLSSVAAMKLELANGTPVVNLTVNPSFSNDILRALIEGFLDAGGMQLQLSCVSPEMLREAYDDPEKHRNLVIRVGGYSEYFCRLDDDLKKLVMDRLIHGA